MPYTYTLRADIPVPPRLVYDTWLDSRGHSAMTGGKARQSDRVGDMVSAWDDYITGQNVELLPGRRIVQTWRTTQFTDEHADSTITVTLAAIPGGTRMTLKHANVPDGQTSYEQEGWRQHYFEPMQRYFHTAAKVADVIVGRPRPAATAKKRGLKKAAAKKTAKKKKSAVVKAAKKKPARRSAPRTGAAAREPRKARRG